MKTKVILIDDTIPQAVWEALHVRKIPAATEKSAVLTKIAGTGDWSLSAEELVSLEPELREREAHYVTCGSTPAAAVIRAVDDSAARHARAPRALPPPSSIRLTIASVQAQLAALIRYF